MMTPLIAESPRDGYVLRWIDPDVAEFVEALPEFGEALITLAHGIPTKPFKITRSYLYTRPSRKGGRDG